MIGNHIRRVRAEPVTRLALVAAILLMAATPASAGLIGDNVTATLFLSGAEYVPKGSAVIGSDIEFNDLFFDFNFDFGESTLSITAATPESLLSWNVIPYHVIFSGFSDEITGFQVVSSFAIGGAFLTEYSFSSHSIDIDFTGLGGDFYIDGYGQKVGPGNVVYGITTVPSSPVPEPGSTLLFLGMAFVPIALSYRWLQREGE